MLQQISWIVFETCLAVVQPWPDEGGREPRNGLAGRRGRRWRGAGEFYVFQLAAELLNLFLEDLDLASELGVKVLAS